MKGLGDLVAAAIGLVVPKEVQETCLPCKQRQQSLNELIPFKNANDKERPATTTGQQQGEGTKEGEVQ